MSVKINPKVLEELTYAYAKKEPAGESDIELEQREVTHDAQSKIEAKKTFKQIFKFSDCLVKNNTLNPVIRFKVVDDGGNDVAAWADATNATHGGLKPDFVCNMLKELLIKYPGGFKQEYKFDELRPVYKLKHLTAAANERRDFPLNCGMSLLGVDADATEMKATNAMIADGNWVEIQLPLPDDALFATFPGFVDYKFAKQDITLEFTFRDPREWFVYGHADCAALGYTIDPSEFEMKIHYAAVKEGTVRDFVWGKLLGKTQTLPCRCQTIVSRQLSNNSKANTTFTVNDTPRFIDVVFIPTASTGKTYFHNAGVTKIGLYQGAQNKGELEVKDGDMRDVIDSFKLCRNDTLDRRNIQQNDFYNKYPVYSFPLKVVAGGVDPSKEYELRVEGANLTQYDVFIISHEAALYSLDTHPTPKMTREV